jgi:hypothetical protein
MLTRREFLASLAVAPLALPATEKLAESIVSWFPQRTELPEYLAHLLSTTTQIWLGGEGHSCDNMIHPRPRNTAPPRLYGPLLFKLPALCTIVEDKVRFLAVLPPEATPPYPHFISEMLLVGGDGPLYHRTTGAIRKGDSFSLNFSWTVA